MEKLLSKLGIPFNPILLFTIYFLIIINSQAQGKSENNYEEKIKTLQFNKTERVLEDDFGKISVTLRTKSSLVDSEDSSINSGWDIEYKIRVKIEPNGNKQLHSSTDHWEYYLGVEFLDSSLKRITSDNILLKIPIEFENKVYTLKAKNDKRSSKAFFEVKITSITDLTQYRE